MNWENLLLCNMTKIIYLNVIKLIICKRKNYYGIYLLYRYLFFFVDFMTFKKDYESMTYLFIMTSFKRRSKVKYIHLYCIIYSISLYNIRVFHEVNEVCGGTWEVQHLWCCKYMLDIINIPLWGQLLLPLSICVIKKKLKLKNHILIKQLKLRI